MAHPLKRCAQDASPCASPWRTSRKRRAVDDRVTGKPAPILIAASSSPPPTRANGVGFQQSTLNLSLPPAFERPPSPSDATTASLPPTTAPLALMSLPSNGLLQAYDPLNARVSHFSHTTAARLPSLPPRLHCDWSSLTCCRIPLCLSCADTTPAVCAAPSGARTFYHHRTP